MTLIFVLLWFAYEHDLVVLKVLGYGFMFIVNFPFINPFGADGIQFQTGCQFIENASGMFQVPILASYTNLYIFSFLALVGVYGSTVLLYSEFKLRREMRERT